MINVQLQKEQILYTSMENDIIGTKPISDNQWTKEMEVIESASSLTYSFLLKL